MNDIKKYHTKHPLCEVDGCIRPSTQIHHIRTRGAGGEDDPENLLALCTEHHGMIHAMGVKTVANAWKGLTMKIADAIKRPKN